MQAADTDRPCLLSAAYVLSETNRQILWMKFGVERYRPSPIRVCKFAQHSVVFTEAFHHLLDLFEELAYLHRAGELPFVRLRRHCGYPHIQFHQISIDVPDLI